MKKIQLLISLSLLLLTQCTSEIYDPRDKVVGKYSGKLIQTYWNGVDAFLTHDTFDVISSINKSPLDSLVNFISDNYSSRMYSFV
ncbi:MAG: hypothetical protein ABI851_12995 [Saprospiraceae bacterium]